MTAPRALAGLLLTLAALTACDAGADRTEVVVSTDILGDITRNIVGDEAGVTVLMKTGSDPHSFGVSAEQAARLGRAGLVVHNGLGLEEGLQHHIDAAAAEGVPTVAVGDAVDPMRVSDSSFESNEADRMDPHFWTDPHRVRAAVDAIADRIVSDVDGVDAARIRENAADYVEQLDALDADMTQRFASIPAEKRKLVTNHHVFGYLAQRFDFDVVGTVLPSATTLASPSASDLRDLADTVRAAGVRVVFADSSHSDRISQVLADEVGLDVRVVPLYSESLGRAGTRAQTYLDMMRANTDDIVANLAR